MKRSFYRRIVLIGVVALLLLSVLSCTQESPIILCNVKLNTDEASRAFNPVSFDNNLSSPGYTLYYSTSYLGTDSSYYRAVTDQVYDSNAGILLSQGRWAISCVWKDSNDVIVAKGSTGPIWVNLNTTSFLVYLDEEGKGSVDFEYVVNKVSSATNTVTDVKFNLSLSKWDGEKFVSIDGITTKEGTKETAENSLRIRTYRDSFNDLEVGKYVLILKTIDNTSSQAAETILFTDVIGFVVKPGHTTVINGSCEVINGVSGNNEYITWEPNPGNPSTEKSNVLPVGGDTTDSSGNKVVLNDPNLNLTDKTVIIINKDTTNNPKNEDKMSLGHTDQKDNQSNRIITPNGGTAENPIRFGINLNGNDVVLSTLTSGFTSESSAIISLPQYSEMTIYNSCDSKREATWAKMNTTRLGDRRFEANVMLQGGTLNVVGPRQGSISNANIVFQGPLWSDVNDRRTMGAQEYQKQGSINVYSPGGSVVLDGDVTLTGFAGISSWATKIATGSTFTETENDLSICLKNNATINAVGDYTIDEGSIFTWDCSDTAYGIKLVGVNNTDNTPKTGGKIKIELNDGHISTKNVNKDNVPTSSKKILTDEACIYIENFNGNITINITNNSSLISESGTAIKIVNCAGSTVKIKIETGCIINSDIIIGSTTLQLTKDSDNRLTAPVDETFTL